MSNAAAIDAFHRKLTSAAKDIAETKPRALRLAAEAARGALAAAPGAPHKVAGRQIAPYVKSETENFRVGWKSPAHLVNNPTKPHHLEQRDFVGPLTLPGIGFRMYADHPGTHGKHFFEAGEPEAEKVADEVFARQNRAALVKHFAGG